MAIEKRIGAYSAYAIAVENGFEGTVEEWLESLIGPRGYQGWGVSAVNVSADGSLIFTIKNPETGETRELEPIQIETLNALDSISTAKDEAVNEVKETQTQATEAVDTAGNQALQDISDAKTSATGAVNTAGENAVNSVNSAGQAAIENAQTAITAAKNQAVSDVQSAGQSAVSAVGDAQTTAVEAVEDAQTNAVQAVQNAGTAEIEKINDILPVPTEADAGKVPVANPDGTGYELGEAGVQIDDTKTALDTTWSSENILLRLCPPFTTEGAIVACQPVEGSRLNTVVQIEPVQEGEGEPSPENIRPITGWEKVTIWRGGKNLFSSVYDNYNPPTKDYATLELKLPNGKYCFHAKQIGETVTDTVVGFADSGTEYTNFENFSGVLWPEGNTTAYPIVREVKNGRLILAVYAGGIDFDKSLFDSIFQNYQIQMEYGDTATEYEPYRGRTFTIPLGQTVYGGTLDVAAGLLTITHKGVALTGSETWTLYPGDTNTVGVSFYTENFHDSAHGLHQSANQKENRSLYLIPR